MRSDIKKILKVFSVVILIIILCVSVYLYKLFGNPYYRISLIGTAYVENAYELKNVNDQLDDKLLLVKKYRYSEDVMLIGWGGGGTRTDDYYWYGVADKDKNILIEPKYESIYSLSDLRDELIIVGRPYIVKGNEAHEYYKIENGEAKLTD